MRFVALLLAAILIISPVAVSAADAPVPVMEHTLQDIYIMGDAAYSENGHTGKTQEEIIQNLIATMGVMLNRCLSTERWLHNTKYEGVMSVIMASGQYADKTKQDLGNIDTPDWVYDLADEVMTYGTNLPSYVIFQSTQKSLGTPWKIIAGEYYATDGGHYMEGEKITITTNKAQYEAEQQRKRQAEQKRLDREFKKKIGELVSKSYLNFSKLLANQQQKQAEQEEYDATILCEERAVG